MSSTTMIPRISRLSGLASRRSSIEQLGDDGRRRDADRAGDDQRLAPCPSRGRSRTASPPPTLSSEVDGADAEQLPPPATRSPSENSRPRWNSSRIRPSVASSSRSSGCSTRRARACWGRSRMPAAMKSGMVGRPMRRPTGPGPRRPATPRRGRRARHPPPSSDDVAEEAGRSSCRPTTTSGRRPAAPRSARVR